MAVLTVPLVQADARGARAAWSEKKVIVPALLIGLAFGALVSSVARSPSTAAEPTMEMALGSMQPMKTRQVLPPVFRQPMRMAQPLQALHPMRTLYSFEPAKPQMAGQSRPGMSMQTRASAQPAPPVVRADSPFSLPFVTMKFGGSSVSTVERWGVITTQMKKLIANGERPFVAISALGSVTNRLGRSIDEAKDGMAPDAEGSSFNFILDAHAKLAGELGVTGDKGMDLLNSLLAEAKAVVQSVYDKKEADSPKLRAKISSYGELCSTALGVMAINKAGIPCVRLDARKLIKSKAIPGQADEDKYLQAFVTPTLDPAKVKAEMDAAGAVESSDVTKASAVLVQGFIGATPEGDTCLLGRGGSDTSGALYAALVGAKKYEIWTDVHGLFTSDPRFVEGTRLIKTSNYRTAQELATLGAKVLHEKCLVPAAQFGIPVEVHNTADPDGQFSKIEAGEPKPGARMLGVAYRKGQTLVNIKTSNSLWGEADFLGKVFGPVGEMGVAVDLVAMSQYKVSICFDYIPGGVEGAAFKALSAKLGALGTIEVKPDLAVVSAVGENLREAFPALGGAMAEIQKKKVYMMSQSSEDLSISFVVDEADATAVVESLHNVLLGKGGTAIDNSVFGGSWDELKTEFLKVEAR
jgi:diaminopimelate decarboxylase/aspartate kinase